MSKLIRLAVLLAVAAVGTAPVAGAAGKPHHGKAHAAKLTAAKRVHRATVRQEQPGENEQAGEAESAANDGDEAQQAAACKAAGIDPNASNVNYEDTTGTCSLDTGGH